MALTFARWVGPGYPAIMTAHPISDRELLDLAIRLTRDASAAILKVRADGFDVLRKGDRSPVTAADHAAEAIILAGLREATPHIPAIAEEQAEDGNLPETENEYWLVDPLDGTREFANGLDDFCVNIGLVRNGEPILGAVAIPATGEVFAGIKGLGAEKHDATGIHRITARVPPPEGVTVLASRHHGDVEQLNSFLAGRTLAEMRNFGSAVKFCRMAEGLADLYPRFGRTMEWDTAAPQAVLEAAGGKVCTMDGKRLAYGKPGWENPNFYCQGK